MINRTAFWPSLWDLRLWPESRCFMPASSTGRSDSFGVRPGPARESRECRRTIRARCQGARRFRGSGAAIDPQFTDRADLGFLGEPRVNVLMLNIALDQRFPAAK